VRSRPLPRAVPDLWFAIEGLRHPRAIRLVEQVVFVALRSTNPGGEFNLHMRRLRNRAATLKKLETYLNRADVTRAANLGGASWSRRAWLDALKGMRAGSSPMTAFGACARGRRHSVTFSHADNIAAYIENKVRQNQPVGVVLDQTRELLGNRMPDDRVLRAARSGLSVFSNAEISAIARHAAWQERLP
jgi:hypothetical protein